MTKAANTLEKVAQAVYAASAVPDYDKRAVAQSIARAFELDAEATSELERVASEAGYKDS